MKGSCTLVASMLAASTVALSSSSASSAGDRDATCQPVHNEGLGARTRGATAEKEKFAPRFDGLRFIETLVTAHR